VFFNYEYEVTEQARDVAVTHPWKNAGIEVRLFDDQTVVPLHESDGRRENK
jgi:deoxyribodipyrimidine photolyase